MLKYSLILYAVLSLCCCTYIYEDFGTSLDYSPKDFTEGVSHFHNALEQLGPPTTVSAYENGLLFMYEHIKTQERQLGLNFDIDPLPWFQWLKFSFARGNDDREALLMIFDEQGILQTRCYESWGDNLGGGFAMELFFSVQTLVDTTAYQDLIGPNQWGTSLLNPLPQTLNARQSLETGQNGLELIATPTKAGQHTLEMR